MRSTIYSQFLAGEEKPDVLKTSRRFTENGVLSMFSYTAAEAHGIGK